MKYIDKENVEWYLFTKPKEYSAVEEFNKYVDSFKGKHGKTTAQKKKEIAKRHSKNKNKKTHRK